MDKKIDNITNSILLKWLKEIFLEMGLKRGPRIKY